MTIHFLLTIIINTKGSEINYCNKNVLVFLQLSNYNSLEKCIETSLENLYVACNQDKQWAV